MNELILLYLLLKGQCTMYGLSKSLKKNFGSITKPGFGTLQPALKRLEKQGLIKADRFFTEGGKPYYYYSITQNGKGFLKKKILEKPSINPIQFYPCAKIKLACSDILESGEKKDLYSTLKNEAVKIKSETEKNLKSDWTAENYCQKMVLDNTLCEYNNFIALIEGLEHACNG
ncbi:MAG: PadR family transcriptional regulator [Candidatus Gastranaerophilales bacterium]|nr:PadR family transcriptional regulator [Candidatus Gastranaerophilales bacterium]